MIQVLFQMPKEEKRGDALNSAPDTQGDGEKRGDLVQPQLPKRGGGKWGATSPAPDAQGGKERGCFQYSPRYPRGEKRFLSSPRYSRGEKRGMPKDVPKSSPRCPKGGMKKGMLQVQPQMPKGERKGKGAQVRGYDPPSPAWERKRKGLKKKWGIHPAPPRGAQSAGICPPPLPPTAAGNSMEWNDTVAI